MDDAPLPSALFRSTMRAIPGAAPRKPIGDLRYERVGALGAGGMGSVERGRDRFLGREVALKRSLSDDPRLLEVLLREAEIAARLQHPSIVTIHDVAYDEEGAPFVVMRLVDGRPLSELVAETPDLEARLRLLPRVAQAIEAVAFAHRHGVVHRDLKPSNIVVAELGDTVVIDWGLALAGPDPFEGESVGTPGFMSPEQEHGDAVDARTDVYALGVTLFYLLSGRMPAKEPLVEIEPGVPRDLATIVETARARDAERRYASAVELASELGRFIGGQLVSAHHYGLGARIVRQLRRHRLVFTIAAAALVASAAIGTAAIRGVVRAKAEAETAQQREAKRADEILVWQARAALATDPARALALLDHRAGPRDAASWAIGIEAATRGVPHAWKAHDRPVTGVIALRDGGVVSTAVDRAVLRTPGGAVRELARSPRDAIAAGDGFAIATADGIELYDRAGERRARWPAATEKIELASAGAWLAWCDGEAITARTLDGGATRTVPGPCRELAIDPAARWLAATRPDGVQVVELATGAAHHLAAAAPEQPVWSASGARLAASTRAEVLEWSAADWARAPRSVPARPVGRLAYRGERAVVRTPRGCIQDLTYPVVAYGCSDDDLTAFAALHGRFAQATGSQLAIHARSSMTLLGAPGTISRISLDEAGEHVAAGTREGMVASWDTRAAGLLRTELAVRSLALLPDGTPIVATEDALVAAGAAPRRIAASPTDSPTRTVVAVGDALLLVHDPLHQRAWTVRVASGEVVREFPLGGFAVRDERSLVVRDGPRVVVIDVVTGTRRIAAEHAGAVAAIGGGRGATAAAWADGHVWWQDGAGTAREAGAGCVPSGFRLRDDDAIELACGRTLLRLSPSQRTVIAELADPIADWAPSNGGYLVATSRKAVWSIGALVLQLAGPSAVPPSLTEARFVTADGQGAIVLHDLASGTTLQVGRLDNLRQLGITTDGLGVIAASPTELLHWRDPVPTEDAAWRAWRARLTNATLAHPTAAIEWR